MADTNAYIPEVLNVTNGTDDDVIATATAGQEGIQATMIAIIVMLSIFFFIGTIGNALAFIIYYRKREKGTSTIFILSLTVTDFFICLISIPWAIIHELNHYKYTYDIFCRAYVFLSTFNIPLSSYILVVIGFDRYFCICHPFLHVITVPRSKVIVGVLVVLAILTGVVPTLVHSIYYYGPVTVNVTVPVDHTSSGMFIDDDTTFSDSMDIVSSSIASSMLSTTSSNHAEYAFTQTDSGPESSTNSQLFTEGLFLHPESKFMDEMQHSDDAGYQTSHQTSNVTWQLVNQTRVISEGRCVMSTLILNKDIFDTYQGFYASLFLIEFVIIMILYALIFRSIIIRRAWRAKRRQKSNYSTASCVDTEETQLTTVNGNGTDATTTVKKTSSRISAAMRDRTLYANIRTAAMLFVVTVVFVLSYLLSWLTSLRMIRFNLFIFYTYYFNNVANPIIYAFMNRTFRDELVLLIKNCLCRRL